MNIMRLAAALYRGYADTPLSTSLRRLALLWIAFLAADPCRADPGAYLGIRAGAVDGTPDTGNAGLSSELFGGYRFNDAWSLEVGATAQSDDIGEYLFEPGAREVRRSEWSALTVAARADVPLSARSRAHLRGGIAAVDAELTNDLRYVRHDGAVVDVTHRYEGTSIGTVLATGVDVALSDRWSVGVELQHLTGELEIGCGAHPSSRCGFNRRGSVRTAALSLRADF